MSKTHCKTDKKKRRKYEQDPRFICHKCGTRVHKKDQACKPKKI